MNSPAASTHFKKTLLACAIAAVAESAIALTITEPGVLVFVLGPLVFLLVIAWRRRTHLARARRLHGLAVGVGTFGIASFAVAFLLNRNNPQPEQAPMAPVVVPFVQWVAVLFVWIAIARQESRKKTKNNRLRLDPASAARHIACSQTTRESLMRPWLTALGVTCAVVGVSVSQQPNPLGGGTIVSSGSGTVSPAGTRIPAAAPPAGSNVGNPAMRPYDPNRPLDVLKGANLSAKNVVAPVTGIGGTQQPDLLDRLTDKLGSITRIFKPSTPPGPVMQQPVTPGIFRRNRERNKMEWRRD